MRQRTIRNTILTVLVCLFAIAGATNAKTIYVDADAAGANDGSSWADAYNYLQDGLSDANASPKTVEIRVAQGTYRPDEDSVHPNGTGDRDATFLLINGVTLKGDYAGFGEPDPNARDIHLYETILSGDLDGNDVALTDPDDLPEEPTRGENSYHVVVGSRTDATAVLDGFTITGGHTCATSPHGGGMYNTYGSPMVINCTFTCNTAGDDGGGGGGGMSNWNSNPSLVNCTFMNNVAGYDSSGGGMYNDDSNPTLTNCTFRGNLAEYAGGGMMNYESNPTLMRCTFVDNFAQCRGGGVCNYWGSHSPMLVHCTFSGNRSDDEGGGIYNFSYSSPALVNCVFKGNFAKLNGGGIANCYGNSPSIMNCMFIKNSAGLAGGGVYNHGYYEAEPTLIANCTFARNLASNGNAVACDSYKQSYPIDLVISNCIIWDGYKGVWNNDSSAIIIRYSDVQDVWSGEDNIDLDPCFADPGYWDANGTPDDANDDFWVDGEYHLKSQAGRWDASEGRWVIDDVTSPCIDAGDPMSPIGLEPFPNGGRINMGAYGGTAEASKSYFGEPPCETIVAGDINGDCAVDFKDFVLMALHWLGGG